jgi:hypothetical protein
MDWPLSKIRKEKCKDGTYRNVFKNPQDAFPLYIDDLKVQVHNEIELLKQFKMDTDVVVQRLASGLLFQIDSVNISMQAHFRAIYLGYSTNPCANDKWFTKGIDRIIKQETKMRDTMNRLHLSYAKTQDIKGALSAAADEIASETETSPRQEIEEALRESEEWKKKQ